jgi:cyclopropane fatty-acyl-phospholipid synthase-like methyltransferase
MESKTVDSVEFRDGQRHQWNSAATGWRRWSELIDGAASGISERLVELAGVERGSRVLDVAAGYGEPSLTAARRAGSEGSVVATDISVEMIASHPQEVQDETWVAITDAIREATGDGGAVTLSNLVLLAAGRA